MEPETVWVRRHWNDTLGAEYRLTDVSGWHWSRVSGGVRAVSPRPMMTGYVMCDQMIAVKSLARDPRPK
ncbi:hypothetical protein C3477_24660 [Mycobacterium kansasii]|nr:hypothetical protein C3B43_00360 [Mycobacterium kansasii]POX97973.1 hypothetical protein C3477_24660 [Mycobacterium kansasii]POY24452.1 hypothetical protein C3476_04320 [Mycobacterium kansasii]